MNIWSQISVKRHKNLQLGGRTTRDLARGVGQLGTPDFTHPALLLRSQLYGLDIGVMNHGKLIRPGSSAEISLKKATIVAI